MIENKYDTRIRPVRIVWRGLVRASWVVETRIDVETIEVWMLVVDLGSDVSLFAVDVIAVLGWTLVKMSVVDSAVVLGLVTVVLWMKVVETGMVVLVVGVLSSVVVWSIVVETAVVDSLVLGISTRVVSAMFIDDSVVAIVVWATVVEAIVVNSLGLVVVHTVLFVVSGMLVEVIVVDALVFGIASLVLVRIVDAVSVVNWSVVVGERVVEPIEVHSLVFDAGTIAVVEMRVDVIIVLSVGDAVVSGAAVVVAATVVPMGDVVGTTEFITVTIVLIGNVVWPGVVSGAMVVGATINKSNKRSSRWQRKGRLKVSSCWAELFLCKSEIVCRTRSGISSEEQSWEAKILVLDYFLRKWQLRNNTNKDLWFIGNEALTARCLQQLKSLNATVVSIIDQHVPVTVESDTLWKRQLWRCWTHSRTSSDTSKSIRSWSNDAMIETIDNEQIPVEVKSDRCGTIEWHRSRRTISCYCHCTRLHRRKELDTIIATICNKQVQVRIDVDSLRRVEHRRGGSSDAHSCSDGWSVWVASQERFDHLMQVDQRTEESVGSIDK